MEWRSLPDDPRYEVSEAGDLRLRATGRIRKPYVGAKGYVYFNFYLGGGRGHTAPQTAHSLVAAAFLGPRPSEAHEVAHGDGSPSNNHWRNLRWATKKENAADRRLHGRDTIGERHGMASLREAQVLEVFTLAARGLSQRAIGRRLGIHQKHVHRILHRKNWAHVEIPQELAYKPRLHTPMAA